MGPRLIVSEFPNDNPELHDGLVWACPAPCAPALPTLRLRPAGAVRVLKPGWERQTPVPPAVAPELVETAAEEPPAAELLPDDVTVRAETAIDAVLPDETGSDDAIRDEATVAATTAVVDETTMDEAPPSGFAAFIAALSAVLAERGATRAAASIGALLGRTRLTPDAFDAPTTKGLVARGILDAKSQRPTPEFSVIAHAWRDVLDGTGGDLAACGSTTLDVFGAELLVALLSMPSGRRDELRRALRQRGVAAFGMLVAA